MPVIEINRRALAYREYGSGFPILFGHSYLWNSAMWQPQIDVLARRFRCIVPDLWGHGGSDSPTHEKLYTLDQLTFDYQQFLEALGVSRCLVVGLSVGGMWAYRLALAKPGLVAGLLLAGTDAGDEPEEARRQFFDMMDKVATAGRIPPPMIEQMLPLFFADPTLREPPPFVDGFRRSLAGLSGERLPGVLAIGRGIFGRTHLLHHLRDITCPTTVVVGEQDRSRPVFEARRTAKGIAGADLHIVPGAGHICNLEAPDVFTGLIEELLTRFEK